jgi:hypothetical protein
VLDQKCKVRGTTNPYVVDELHVKARRSARAEDDALGADLEWGFAVDAHVS